MKNKQTGFSLIELCIVVVLIGIIAAIAIPNLFAARRASNEASAIASLRTISSAQETYESTAGRGDFGDLAQLMSAGVLDSSFLSGRSGYSFQMNAFTRANNNGMGVFNALAVPVQFGRGMNGTGTRYFFTNESGVLFQSDVEGSIPQTTSSTDRTVINGVPINQ